MKKFFLKNKSNIKIFELGIHQNSQIHLYQNNNINKKEPLYPLNCLLDKKSGCIFNEIITPDTKDIIFTTIPIPRQIQIILKTIGKTTL